MFPMFSFGSGTAAERLSRLLEYAPLYYDLKTFPDSETKRALQKAAAKKYGPAYGGVASGNGKRSGSSSKAGTPEVRESKKQKRVT
jgi:pre-mRNA-splicing factor ATP-dependent RNA helicase DHX15/PRP43